MRSGGIDAVVDNNYDATAWELANATAEHFARGKAFPAYGTSFKYPGIGDPLAYTIVTKGNLPKRRNTYVAPAGRRRHLLHREVEGRGPDQVATAVLDEQTRRPRLVRRLTTFRRKSIVVRRRTTVINMEWGVPQRSFPVERCGTPH